MAGPVLEIRNLHKEILRKDREPFTIFKNINLSLRDGEFVSVVGPSGCGKTTMLRVINGLMPRTSGEIFIDGKSAEDLDHELVMGFVFQGASLLPWRTSLRNVLLGLEGRGQNPNEAEQNARKYLELVGLSGFENHYPHELSGGMRQRANIIRTLIYDPELILMDEPFGPLDAQTRIVLQDELLKLWSTTKKTIIFITHDLIEAITLADRVVLMSSRPGRIKAIEQVSIARPRDVFKIHQSEQFRAVYENLWRELRPEVKLAEA